MRLTELYEAQFDLEKFKSDCAPFLRELKGAETYPYHGTHSGPDDFEVRTFKERIYPRDTPPNTHKKLNALFKEKLDHEIRNWMFISGAPGEARVYGTLYCIFPIGANYHYVWSPFVEDMSTHRTTFIDRAHQDKEVKDLPYDDRISYGDDQFMTDIAMTPFHVDKNLKDGLESKHEIHLKCEQFYIFKMLGPTFENVINPYLRKEIVKHETD